jgi:hypothetical protein
MTREELLKENKLIAEFMGAFKEEGQLVNILTVPLGNDEWYLDIDDEESGQFHTSWDWLIPVIDKIYSSDEYYKYKSDSIGIFEREVFINTKYIEETFKSVVEFINWYNKQK